MGAQCSGPFVSSRLEEGALGSGAMDRDAGGGVEGNLDMCCLGWGAMARCNDAADALQLQLDALERGLEMAET